MPSEMKRLKQLEEENSKLKKLIASLSLENFMLQDVIRRSSQPYRWHDRPITIAPGDPGGPNSADASQRSPRPVCVMAVGVSTFCSRGRAGR